jgi:hypothetical protein
MADKSTGTVTTGATSATSGSSIGSKIMTNKMSVLTIISGLVFVSLFIAAFVEMQSFVGSKDDWNQLKPQLTKITILVTLGMIAFAIASVIYFTQNPAKSIYFTIVISTIALGLAFMSLSVAAISR